MDPPKRILVVDDDPAVLELSIEVLQGEGFAVVVADGGRAALLRLQAGEAFDAMVTDHSMPGMSGMELVAQARVLRPGLPCLLVTGHGDGTDGDAGVRVLAKPYRNAHYAAAVRALLESR